MKRNCKHFAAACAVALLTVSVTYAHKAGPDPRHTGAPGDDPLACTTSGCHTGVPLNSAAGHVEVQFPDKSPDNKLTYTPGQQQMLTVMVSDPSEKFYGFQMTARLSSDPSNGQAGDFTVGPLELVLCDDGSRKGSQGCRANASVQFMEHSTPSSTGTWTVAWTPPATDVGDVFIFIAGNSNTQTEVPDNGHVYTAQYKLTAASAGGGKPSIAVAQVAAGFNAKAPIASGTWLEIYGSNLATTTRGWQGPDFVGAAAPTSLNGVTVKVNGKLAYVDFVSEGQVNVQVPDDPAVGPVQIVLSNAAGDSPPLTVQKVAVSPAVLAPSSFIIGGKQYVAASYNADPSTFVGKANLISGLKFRPAKAGDIIVVYGIGFGPVTPGNAAGLITGDQNTLQAKPTFRFGQTPATLVYAGLAPGFLGLYQFDVKVPTVPSGDQALSVDVGGVSTNQSLFVTTQ